MSHPLPRAKKRLGQHWLDDESAVQRIIEAAELTGDETVIEVGPGPGVLTPGLAAAAGKIIAIELDADVLPTLEKATAGLNNLEIKQADILGIDPVEFPDPYEVVGNVPYYITSAIIRHFMETAHRPRAITVTIQAEVAERIAATPPKMSVLAVSVQLYGQPKIVGRIGRKSFRPAPDVDSAILRIEDIGDNLAKTLDGVSEEQFFKVVRAGFAEKRKQLHNTLAHNLALSHEVAAQVLVKSGIDAVRRAETLTIAEWVQLSRAIQSTN